MSILRKEWGQRQARHGPSLFLNRRTALLLAGALTLGIGAALNWDWLIAAGIGPIVLSLLPCAVMCVIGVCMHKGKRENGLKQCCQGRGASHSVSAEWLNRLYPRFHSRGRSIPPIQAGC